MTTIAIDKKGDIAVDSRLSGDAGSIVSDEYSKHFISQCKTFLFLFTGDAGKFKALKTLSEAFRSKPSVSYFYTKAFLEKQGFNYSELFTDSCSFIIVERINVGKKVKIKVYEFYKPDGQDLVVYIDHCLPVAFGSGRRIAKGIMSLDLPCFYGVAGAMKVDSKTGGSIREFSYNATLDAFDYQCYTPKDLPPLRNFNMEDLGYGLSVFNTFIEMTLIFIYSLSMAFVLTLPILKWAGFLNKTPYTHVFKIQIVLLITVNIIVFATYDFWTNYIW